MYPAITGLLTAKRTLTRRPDPCRGIVGPRVVPLSRSASNARLSRRDPCDALSRLAPRITGPRGLTRGAHRIRVWAARSEEHTSELQSLTNLVCRLLLEKKKKKK